MARITTRPRPTRAQTLTAVATRCPICRQPLWADYRNYRTVTMLDGVIRLTLEIRRCPNSACARFHVPYRPEAEAHFALPHHEFGLDVLTLVGQLRYVEHRSVPEIHTALTRRGVQVAGRTVGNLLDRYDELRALATADPRRLGPRLRKQGCVVLAIDGLQPDVGHEVLWVLRDCLSGEVLLARSLLSASQKDLSELLAELRDALPVPITAVVSDGQGSIRNAVAQTLPGVPHQLCQFHYLREAARPIYEADRHAKKELKKRIRGIRRIERQAEEEGDAEGEIVRSYCAAVRSALTDDGRPPLQAPGLRLHERLQLIVESLDRILAQRELPARLGRLRRILQRGLQETAAWFPPVRSAFAWVKRVARLLANEARHSGAALRRRLRRLLRRMKQRANDDSTLRTILGHFVKVSQSYIPGLFACYDVPHLPRTNNDLEHLFGSHKYHERRASGRKSASPGLVVRGSVRVIAALATRLRPDEPVKLSSKLVALWRRLRSKLERRREARRQQSRFRRNPLSYLNGLEKELIQLALPS